MDIPTGLLIAFGAIAFVLWLLMVHTWITVHQAAVEAREYFRRQNAAGRVEDTEADQWMAEHPAT